MLVWSYAWDYNLYDDHFGFAQKKKGHIMGPRCTSSITGLVAGTWRTFTGTWAKVEVKIGVWSIGFCIALGEFVFELRQKSLVLLIKKLCFLPQLFILFHYVTVLNVQLWVQPFHDCETSPSQNYSQCSVLKPEQK